MRPPAVSDRALLRFLDRAGDLDIEQLRARLEGSLARAVAAAESIGVTDYAITADGLSFMVRDGVVSTILPRVSPAGRFHALARKGAPAE